MEKYMEEQQLQQALQRSHMERLLQLQEEDMAQRRAWEEDEVRRQNERNELERRRWSALYVPNQMAINNAKILHDQVRHQRDYEASCPYVEHSGWTDYPNLPVP
ncbi:hypothetical protein HanIR_Chr12g0607071 [Helianthus annuus]|nr:hypothetical protein HanIR_Chr12g0607071 [Helianthus annuus]